MGAVGGGSDSARAVVGVSSVAISGVAGAVGGGSGSVGATWEVAVGSVSVASASLVSAGAVGGAISRSPRMALASPRCQATLSRSA